MRIGIVGLPNVGKSTLFSAASGRSVETSAYPFCTIEPNVAVVPVREEGFRALSKLGWKEERPLQVTFVDVAGLVAGASEGQGLGNQFLSKLREMDVLIHALRAFEDGAVVHVSETVDPEADLVTVEEELLLADLIVLDKAIGAGRKKPEERERTSRLESLREELSGRLSPERRREWQAIVPDMQLLSLKPAVLMANSDEPSELPVAAIDRVAELAEQRGVPWIQVAAKLEAEIGELAPEEAAELRDAYLLSESCLDSLLAVSIRAADWITFYTVENDILGSWRVEREAVAQEAAGRVHTDMAKGFHAVEMVSWQTLVGEGSFEAARREGLVKKGGRDHVVEDGSVLRFVFS